MSKPFLKLKDPKLGLDSQLTFGRHFGYTVSEILKDRPQYIQWLVSNTSLKFHPSVQEELYRAIAKLDSSKPKKYSGYGYLLPDYDLDTQSEWSDWDQDVPF